MLLLAVSIIASEAYLDAKNGDKYHGLSLAISFALYFGIIALFNLPLKGVLLWASTRCYFNLIYNYFKGNNWWYLSSATFDKILTFISGGNKYVMLYEVITIRFIFLALYFRF